MIKSFLPLRNNNTFTKKQIDFVRRYDSFWGDYFPIELMSVLCSGWLAYEVSIAFIYASEPTIFLDENYLITLYCISLIALICVPLYITLADAAKSLANSKSPDLDRFDLYIGFLAEDYRRIILNVIFFGFLNIISFGLTGLGYYVIGLTVPKNL